MKTPIFSEYLRRLVDLNDQLCFYMFNNEELRQKLTNFTPAANPLFTTDLFFKNVYAKKIHVTFEKLPEFQDKNQTLNFGAYFSFSYEFLSSYIDDIIKLLIEHHGITLTDNEMKKDIEKKFKLAIQKCGWTIPSNEFFETITYFRLRRNYFTHVLKELNSKFIHIVRNKGLSLNSFWQSAITELDFTKENVDVYTENETIELIKILRITLEELDKHLATFISREGVAKYICMELYGEHPSRTNLDVVNRRKSEVKDFALRNYMIVLTDSDMDNAVRTIGIRR